MFFIIIIFFSICWTINYLKFRSEIASLKENPEAKIIPLSSHNLYPKKPASSSKNIFQMEQQTKRGSLVKAQ